jgi:hypothetical protein
MSQIASSSPTPRRTRRVMMMGLIGPSDERTVGLVHRTTTGARPVLWNPAEKLGISYGRSSKDGYHIYQVPPTILWSFPLRMQFPVEGYFLGREASLVQRTGNEARINRVSLAADQAGRDTGFNHTLENPAKNAQKAV